MEVRCIHNKDLKVLMKTELGLGKKLKLKIFFVKSLLQQISHLSLMFNTFQFNTIHKIPLISLELGCWYDLNTHKNILAHYWGRSHMGSYVQDSMHDEIQLKIMQGVTRFIHLLIWCVMEHPFLWIAPPRPKRGSTYTFAHMFNLLYQWRCEVNNVTY